MHRRLHLFVFALIFAAQASSADFSFTGSFARDDEKRQFSFTLSKPASVLIRTLSYAGGRNSAGVDVPRGGFDPTLSLFDASGALVASNRDGGCAKVGFDPVTASCWDANIEVQLPAGDWQVVLTQAENAPNGPALADAFVYEGSAEFTSESEGLPAGGFWDFSPDRRTRSWALDVRSVDAAQLWVDPASRLVNGGSFLAGSAAANTILTLIDSRLNDAPNSPQLTADSAIAVTLDGLKAEVLYAGPGQVNFVIPAGATPKAGAVIEVRRGKLLIAAMPIDIEDASPALFTATQTGTGQAAVLNVLASGVVLYNGTVAPAVPAKRGTYLEVYGTGFGAASPPGADGLSRLAAAVTATIGGVPADVAFAGLAPNSTAGLQQINILIPPDSPTGSAIAIRLRAGSHSTQADTTIAIE